MDHTRHSGIFSLDWLNITMIGAGGIGSATSLALAKMGVPDMHVIDMDEIEPHNLPTQLFPMSELGRTKAYAAKRQIEAYSDECKVSAYVDRAGDDFPIIAPVIVSGVDSIASRKMIWDNIEFTWYIDARMGAEVLTIFTVHKDDIEWYDEMLKDQDDESIPDAPCTEKATIYTAFHAAGWIGHTVKQISNQVRPPRILSLDMNNYTLMTVP